MKIQLLLFFLFFLFVGNTFAIDTIEDHIKSSHLKNNSDNTSIELEAFSEKKLGKLLNKFSKGNNVYTINFQGVIDEDSQVGTFADLDGLKNGNKVTIGYSRIFFSKRSTSNAVKHALNECAKTPKFEQRLSESREKVKACKALHKKEIDVLPTEEEREALFNKECKSELDDYAKLPKKCESYQDLKGSVDDIDAVNIPGISLQRMGLEISAGNNTYKWLQEDTFDSKKDDKPSYSAELLYSYINEKYESYTLAYRYEDRWKANDPRDICSPLSDGSTSLACQSIAIAEPQNKTAKVVSFEWKTYFGKNDSKAIAAKLSRDFETDIIGLDIPIYLHQDKKTNGLQGGVKIGFLKNLAEKEKSKSDSDVQFSLFFNKAFSIK